MLTPFQKRKFRILFDHLDSNGNGILQWRDIMVHMDTIKGLKGWTDENPRFIQLMMSEMAYWDKVLERVDADGNGVVSPEEFEAFYASVVEEIGRTDRVPSWSLDLLRSKFRVLDIDGNGDVSQEEFALYLQAIRCPSDPVEVFARVDLNGDGRIGFGELEALFRQFVLSSDPAEPGNYIMCGRCE